MTTATKKKEEQFEEAVKPEPEKTPSTKSDAEPELTIEQVQAQLNYAQKIINVLQGKVNEANGQIVQLEARLLMTEEDKANILKQVEAMTGITPQQ
tara:strand:- start:553 stop:840 length:288 start_codon:yes stop_codon:yes gene_type:complete